MHGAFASLLKTLLLIPGVVILGYGFHSPVLLFFFTIFFLSFVSVSAFAEKVSTYLFCHKKSFARTIRIEHHERGCRTIYTKHGADKEVGNGMYLISCLGFLRNVQKNLIAVGWKCRDVSHSKISRDSK